MEWKDYWNDEQYATDRLDQIEARRHRAQERAKKKKRVRWITLILGAVLLVALTIFAVIITVRAFSSSYETAIKQLENNYNNPSANNFSRLIPSDAMRYAEWKNGESIDEIWERHAFHRNQRDVDISIIIAEQASYSDVERYRSEFAESFAMNGMNVSKITSIYVLTVAVTPSQGLFSSEDMPSQTLIAIEYDGDWFILDYITEVFETYFSDYESVIADPIPADNDTPFANPADVSTPHIEPTESALPTAVVTPKPTEAPTAAITPKPTEEPTAAITPKPTEEPAAPEYSEPELQGFYYLKSSVDGRYISLGSMKWNDAGKQGYNLFMGTKYDDRRIVFEVLAESNDKFILSVKYPNKKQLFLDVWNATDSRSPVDAWPEGNEVDQRWTIELQEDGYYKIIWWGQKGEYALSYDTSSSALNMLRISKISDTTKQKWELVIAPNGEPSHSTLPTELSAGCAEAYSAVLKNLQNNYGLTDAFFLLDMDKDGSSELVVAKTEYGYNDNGSPVVDYDEENDRIIEFTIYTYRDGSAVEICNLWNSYSNSIFKIYKGHSIVTGDSGTAYVGWFCHSYDGRKAITEHLAQEGREYDKFGNNIYTFLYLRETFDPESRFEDREIKEGIYQLCREDWLNNLTTPTLYANTALGRETILGIGD